MSTDVLKVGLYFHFNFFLNPVTIILIVSHGFYTKQNILTALQIPFVKIVEESNDTFVQ